MKVEKTIEEELSKAKGKILERLGIESGDITPFQQVELEKAETKYKKELSDWVRFRLD